MANVLRSIWSFILGSLRLILFFICLLLALGELLIVAVLLLKSPPAQTFELPGELSYTATLFSHVALLAIALLGCYGSFYKHHCALRWFSNIIAIAVVMTLVFVIYDVSTDQLARVSGQYRKKMSDTIADYKWSGSEASESNANVFWDSIQSLQCCGIDGPGDWKPYQPNKNVYPLSCCSRFSIRKQCYKDEVFEVGCMSRIKQIGAYAQVYTFISVIFLFLLATMSYVVSKSNLSDESPHLTTANRGNNTSSEYTRFDGSVYVRQPATNQAYPEQKMPVPSLYPTMSDVERNGPPPSYGYSK